METSGSLPGFGMQLRRLRLYRLLVNSFVTLLALALVLLLIRWLLPWTFAALLFIWTADAIVLGVLAIPWLVVASALALGRMLCPACHAPFTSGFHLWVPRVCEKCGYDVTASLKDAASHKRGSGP